MNRTSMLEEMRSEIEADLKVCADVEDNEFHLKALDAVEFLLEIYYS